ncbi:MAG: hypothetical protein ACJA2N_001708 [Salibacteraceae bacterium]|jgi:hypothetical protein
MKYLLLLISIITVGVNKLQAQFLGKDLRTTLFLESSLSTNGTNPFWIRSNTHGQNLFESNYVSIGSVIDLRYDSTYSKDRVLNKFDLGITITPQVYSGSFGTRVQLNQAHAKARYKNFELFVGRKKEIIGLTDSTLSSGSMSWSGNSLPVPQIKIHIPYFVPLLKSNLISYKASYSHGWFGKHRYFKGIMLHQKSLYLRIGKPKWNLSFTGGFNHNVQWGGQLNNITSLSTINGRRLPNSFSDYLFVVTGLALGNTERIISQTNLNEFDLTNRVGNHLGTIDVGMELKIDKLKIFIYRQSFYDDGSLFYLNNISDGLTGISFKINNIAQHSRKRINFKFIYEFFSSQSQGGQLGFDQNISSLRGRDNYYNHGQFIDGWSLNLRGIGSPFITPQRESKESLPRYINTTISDINVEYFTNNNRVNAHYIGTSFVCGHKTLVTKLSKSFNKGSYTYPFTDNINQISWFIQLESPLKFHTKFIPRIKFAIGGDRGSLFENSSGSSFSINYNFQ